MFIFQRIKLNSFEIDFEHSSASFWLDEENNNYSPYAIDGVKTRIVWVINYTNNEDCMYITLL